MSRAAKKKIPREAPLTGSGVTRRKVLGGLAVAAMVSQITGVTLKDFLPSPSGSPVTVAPGAGSLTMSGGEVGTLPMKWNVIAAPDPAPSHATPTIANATRTNAFQPKTFQTR